MKDKCGIYSQNFRRSTSLRSIPVPGSESGRRDDEYAATFLYHLRQFREKELMTDVTFRLGDATIRCHRVVLGALRKFDKNYYLWSFHNSFFEEKNWCIFKTFYSTFSALLIYLEIDLGKCFWNRPPLELLNKSNPQNSVAVGYLNLTKSALEFWPVPGIRLFTRIHVTFWWSISKLLILCMAMLT